LDGIGENFMNERIKQLAEQCTDYVYGEGGSYEMFDKEKFAELIVNQCADIAQQHNKSPVAAPLAIGYVIREHFGVEE
jgi:hypothetical protein